MPTENIYKFISAIATKEPATAIEVMKTELRNRTDVALANYAASYQYKVQDNGSATTSE